MGLTLDDRVPDVKTIWLFRERVKDSAAAALFADQLEQVGGNPTLSTISKVLEAYGVRISLTPISDKATI